MNYQKNNNVKKQAYKLEEYYKNHFWYLGMPKWEDLDEDTKIMLSKTTNYAIWALNDSLRVFFHELTKFLRLDRIYKLWD